MDFTGMIQRPDGLWQKPGGNRHVYQEIICAYKPCSKVALADLADLKAGKGKYCSHSCAQLARRGARLAGDDVGYAGAHTRKEAQEGSASNHACVDCGETAYDWSYDGLDPDEKVCPESGLKYSTKPSHYQARCRLCHKAVDGQTRPLCNSWMPLAQTTCAKGQGHKSAHRSLDYMKRNRAPTS